MEQEDLKEQIDGLVEHVSAGRNIQNDAMSTEEKNSLRNYCENEKTKQALEILVKGFQRRSLSPSPDAADFIDKIWLLRDTIPKATTLGIVI